MLTNILIWTIGPILGAVFISTLMELAKRLLKKAFVIGIKLKAREKQIKGIERVLAYLYIAWFLTMNIFYRNTVIVIEFGVMPAFQTVSSFIKHIIESDKKYENWYYAKAKSYYDLITGIAPEHF